MKNSVASSFTPFFLLIKKITGFIVTNINGRHFIGVKEAKKNRTKKNQEHKER